MMEESDQKNISVSIAGRNFPIKITPIEEILVLDLVTELNDKVSEFQKTYPGKDKLDCVIMTLLTYAFDQKKSIESTDLDEATQKIDTIKGILKELVKD
ncbi:MAG: cell division protein ZapA [Saprospiraceae bacterium]|nr:cell division protein ZapA [Saprospiraceae bacterium]